MIDVNKLFLEINKLKVEFLNIEEKLNNYDEIYKLIDKYYDIKLQIDGIENNDLKNDFKKLSELFEYNLKKYSVFYVANADYISRDDKYLFYKELYYFEKIIVPDSDGRINYISSNYKYKIISLAAKYADKNNSYYVYYRHNPYGEIDGDTILIIEKKEFTDKDLFLNDVSNYVSFLYDKYYYTYRNEIEQLKSKLNVFDEKYAELNYFYEKKYNEIKLIVNAEEYYNSVNQFENSYERYKKEIIDLGLYYYIELKDKFEELFNKIENFIFELKNDERYKKYFSKIDFDKFVSLLKEYIDYLYYNKNEEFIEYIKGYNIKEIIEKIIYYMKNYYYDITIKYFSFEKNEFETKTFKFYDYVEFEKFIKEYIYKLSIKSINLIELNVEKDIVRYPEIYDLKKKFDNLYSVFEKYKNDYYEIYSYEDMKIVKDNYLKLKKKLIIVATNYFMNAMKNLPNVYYNYFEKKFNSILKEINDFEKKLDEIIENKKNNEYSDDMKLVFKAIDDIEYYYNKAEMFKKESVSNLILMSNLDIFDKIIKIFGDELNIIKNLFKQEKFRLCIENYLEFKKLNSNYMEIIKLFDRLNEKYKWLQDNIDEVVLEVEKKLSYNDIYRLIDKLGYFKETDYIYNRNKFILDIDILYDYIKSIYPDNVVIISNERDFKKSYYDNLLFYYFIAIVYSVYKNINPKYDKLEQLKNIYNNQSEFLKMFIKSINYISNNSFLDQFINSIFNVLINYTELFIPDLMRDLSEYNKMFDIDELYKILNKFTELEEIKLDEYENLENNNYIYDVKYVDIDDITYMEVYGPINIKFKASALLDAPDIDYTIKWYYGDGKSDEGKSLEIYFDYPGEYTIIVELLYSDGKKYVKNIKIKVLDIKLTSYLRIGSFTFSNQYLAWDIKYRPKLYYFDNENGYPKFVTLDLKSPLDKTLKDGVIYFDSNLDKMSRDLSNVFLFGFYGDGVPGNIVTNNYLIEKIKNADSWWDVEIPEMEFLFDFRYSMPIEKRMVLDIRNSVNILKMFRIPSDVDILKDIDDISEFAVANAEYLEVKPGDKVGFLNKKGRWATIEFKDIYDETEMYKYDFKFDVRFIVNTADEIKLKTNFKTQIFEMDFPLIQFETNLIELFNSIINRINKINELKKKISQTNDKELINTYLSEIDLLEKENTNNYVSMEINILKQKRDQLMILFESYYGKYYIEKEKRNKSSLLTYDYKIDIEKYKEFYQNEINSFRTFKEIVNDIEPHDFYSSLIDMKKYISVIEKEIIYLEKILSLFRVDFEEGFFEPFYEFLKEEGIIEDEKIFDGLLDIEKAIKIIKLIRERLYKLKLINDLDTKSISILKFNNEFKIWRKDFVDGKWKLVSDKDKYLFYKKLELIYGKEVGKIEDGMEEIKEISELVEYIKNIDNLNMDKKEIMDKSKYIQDLEEEIIEEYDKFYLISYWITYIEKKYIPNIRK
jgi:plastocyanin